MNSREVFDSELNVIDFADRKFGNSLEENSNRTGGPNYGHFQALATCLGDQVSARQVALARGLAGKAGIDEDRLSWRLFSCDFSELSKRGAEQLIEHLRLEVETVQLAVNLRLAG